MVGIDASAAAMAEASRRAAASPRRGGRPNALFVAAAAEALPPELDGLADLVTVHFPWGSLLRGLLGADPGVVGGIARVMRPGARLDLLVSVTDRDHGAGASPLEAKAIAALAPAYRRLGLELDRPRLVRPGGCPPGPRAGGARGAGHPGAALRRRRPPPRRTFDPGGAKPHPRA